MSRFLDSPLILAGAAILALFLIFRIILGSGILKPATRRETAPLLHKILNYGFLLGFTVVVLGFSLAGWRTQKESSRGKQAKLLLAAEVTQNIRNIDERLGYFETMVDQPIQNERVARLRERLMPAVSSILAEGYAKSMNEQRIASLRQMLNSSPLRTEGGASAIDNLISGGVNAELYENFYQDIAETERLTESLLDSLALLSSLKASSSKEWIEHTYEELQVATENLEIQSQISYLAALRIFYLLPSSPFAVAIPESTQEALRHLAHLRPPRLPAPAEIQTLSLELAARKEKLVARKRQLVAKSNGLLEAVVDQYEKLDDLFAIHSTDRWDEVVGKAVSLRQLGRTSEAFAAFARYSDMFSESDGGAKEYSRTAQAFTVQKDVHGMKGGVYIFQVKRGSKAERAGFRIGDVIVAYGGMATTDMPSFVEATKAALVEAAVQVRRLRLTPPGKFESLETTVEGGELGIGTMPI